MSSENYVYKKEVDWSLLNYGFAIPLEYQVIFKQIAGRFLERKVFQTIRDCKRFERNFSAQLPVYAENQADAGEGVKEPYHSA